jgi:nitroreductase
MSQNTNLIEALNWRYAVKKFDPSKKISDSDWVTLSESLRLSPSSYGLQPWKFILVKSPELRAQLRAHSWNQSQVEDASHYVVFTYKEKIDQKYIEKYLNTIASQRSIPIESLKGFGEVMTQDLINGPRASVIEHWAQRQAYIAMGFLMLSAALLKIDSCPMEGIVSSEYDKLLGIENSGYKTVAAVALGYRHEKDDYQRLKKVRFEASDIFLTR